MWSARAWKPTAARKGAIRYVLLNGRRHAEERGQPLRHQLAGLAALDALIEIAMRALVESYPEFRRESRPTDSAEARSAAALVDLCGRFLQAIDHHRQIVARQLPSDDRTWPF